MRSRSPGWPMPIRTRQKSAPMWARMLLQPVVAGDAAAALGPNLAGGEIDLVVQDDDGVGRKAVETHGGAHRAARIVHVSLRLEREHGLVADAALGDLAVEAGAPLESAEAMRRCQRIERHEAHVVAMPGRIGAGVAEADQQAGGGAALGFSRAAEDARVRSPRFPRPARPRHLRPLPRRLPPVPRPLRLPPPRPARR